MHRPTMRKTRGLLAVGAVFAAVLLSGPSPAEAAPAPDPTASFCAPIILSGWYGDPLRLCRQMLQQMRAGQRPTLASPAHPAPSVGHRVIHRRLIVRRPVARPRKAASSRAGRAAGVAAPPLVAAPPVAHAEGGSADDSGLSMPSPLIWLLLPLIGAIAFALHRLVLVPTGTVGAGAMMARVFEPEPEFVAATSGLDPYIFPGALGLRGPGAVDAARFMVLTVLEATKGAGLEGTVLVVVPRAEANLLFGLGEDELVDEPGGPLFLPGTLDGALSFLETELADRDRHGRDAPRLVLVAAPEPSPAEPSPAQPSPAQPITAESGIAGSSTAGSSVAESSAPGSTSRIQALVRRYPRVLSVIVIGDWPDGAVTVDEDGAVDAAARLVDALPARLPALSRTESRDRLTALLRA